MPLIQSASKKALQKNIETEIKAGKDPKQAAAIAYNIQRENDALNGVQATKRIESIPISARREMNNSDDRAATLLGILSEMQDIIDSTVQNERNEVKSKAEKILNDLKKQYNLENAKYIKYEEF